MSDQTLKMQAKSGYQILDMPIEVLPKGMVGAFSVMMVIGSILNEIGNILPIVRIYLSGDPMVSIFYAAALSIFNIISKSAPVIMTNFMKGEDFLDFYIAALITGSILWMDRKLLIKASAKYLAVILGGVVLDCGSVLVGKLLGFYPVEASITGGLWMINMSGTGDVVLSPSNRMIIMAFDQISSRLGGVFMMILQRFF